MVAIIILNFNSADKVASCIASIREHTKCEYKIYIVDNASSDGSGEQLRKSFNQDDVEVILCRENRGYSAGNNVGLLRAREDGAGFYMIVNPDVVLLNDVASLLMESCANDENVGVAAPYIEGPDGGFFQQFITQYSFKKAIFQRHPLTRFAPAFPSAAMQLEVADIMQRADLSAMTVGCCFMMSAGTLAKLGLLDENIFLYYEEQVIAQKLMEQGLLLGYVPDARIIHNHTGKNDWRIASIYYHRSVSSLYVLRQYCKCSGLQLRWVYFLDSFYMLLRAVRDREFGKAFLKHRKNRTKILKG